MIADNLAVPVLRMGNVPLAAPISALHLIDGRVFRREQGHENVHANLLLCRSWHL
jgi:hypothetical protein